jgi:hypothetical protein
MKERRRAEQNLAEAAREYPEMAAKVLLLFARMERDRLRQQLLETFGFSLSRARVSAAASPPATWPRTP